MKNLALKELWKKSNKYQKTILAILCLCIIVGLMVFNGYVLSTLWFWFVVPIFSVKAISVAEAIGIMFFISYVIHQRSVTAKDTSTEFVEAIIFSLLKSSVGLLFGWIVTLFL